MLNLRKLLPPHYRRKSNVSTWTVCILVRNNPDLHQLLIAMLANRDQLSPVGARLIGGRLFPKRALPVDGASWDNVNWCDVAQSWTDLYSEHLRNTSGFF